MDKKVIHINTTGYGGAFNAAYNLHKLMCSGNIQSHMIVKDHSPTEDGNLTSLYKQKNILSRAWNKFLPAKQESIETDGDYYFFDYGLKTSSAKDIIKHFPYTPDVIILHWITGFIDAEAIKELSEQTNASVIWHLVDMAPMTGGCHYAWSCEGYMNDCTNCPAILDKDKKNISTQNLANKIRQLTGVKLNVVAPTHQLEAQCNSAKLFRNRPIHKILIPVDSSLYFPASDKAHLRRELKLPLDHKVIFFGSERIGEKRKGMKFLIEALLLLHSQLSETAAQKVTLLVAGYASAIEEELSELFPVKATGYVVDQKRFASFYQCADMFVCPSIEDSGPMMINESIACGTPVVSFDIGVSRDLVHTGRTGYRAVLKNSKDLAAGILQMLNRNEEEVKEYSKQISQLRTTVLSEKEQYNAFHKLIHAN